MTNTNANNDVNEAGVYNEGLLPGRCPVVSLCRPSQNDMLLIIIIILSAVNKNQIYSTYPMFIFVKPAFGGHCLHFQVYTINSMI